MYASLGIGAGKFAEEHQPYEPQVLPAIRRLASEQEARFRARLDEIEEKLGRAGL